MDGKGAYRVVAKILPPMLSRTQSFLEVASGVGANAVTLSPKSPVALETFKGGGWSCGGGGLVVADEGVALALSGRSRRSTIEEEVLRAECMDWASEGESSGASLSATGRRT